MLPIQSTISAQGSSIWPAGIQSSSLYLSRFLLFLRCSYLLASLFDLLQWIEQQVKSLDKQREIVWDAIKDMEGTTKSYGGIYFLVKLPPNNSNNNNNNNSNNKNNSKSNQTQTDVEVVEYLCREWNVLVLPCNTCGVDRCIRVSYGNLTLEECEKAAIQLKKGLQAIRDGSWKQSATITTTTTPGQ